MTRYQKVALFHLLVVFAISSCGNSDDKKGASCAAPAACGGTLDGTWQLDSSCVQGDEVALLNATPGNPAACSTLFQKASDSASGTVTYANGTQTSNVTKTSKYDVLYTQACVAALRGAMITLDATACATVQQSAIDSGNYTRVSCSYSSAGCPCTFVSQSTDTSTVNYTVSGTSIVYANGDPPADYCVSGNTMTLTVAFDTPQGTFTSVGTMHR
jgi:hypothetical protein